MKLKKILVAALVAGMIGGGLTMLAACGGKKDDSGDKTGTKYKVTYDASEDYQISGLKAEYAVDEDVSFSVSVLNDMKLLSSVRFDNKRLTESDGVYTAKMPDHDAQIKVTLTDVATPKFELSFAGTPEVGQTLTFSSTIDGQNNDTFELSATKGANLVTISGKQVQLNAVGDVTIKATATSGKFNLTAERFFTISESEASLGVNVTYHDEKIRYGGESSIKNDLGKYYYWAGDGGVVSDFGYKNGEYYLDYSTGWAWYSVQIFYGLPYGEVGETYKMRWTINSPAAGNVTISGQVIELVEGENNIALDLTVPASLSIISVQLGVNGDGTVLDPGILKFSAARFYDADPTHTYHEVKFTANDKVLTDIQVKDGKTVKAPTAPEITGKVLEGFYDGDTKYDPAMTISKDYNFVARYVDKTADNTKYVTIKNGNVEIAKLEVAKDSKISIPTNLNLGFGKQITGLFTDAGLTTAFDLNTAITDDVTLYARVGIVFDKTYFATADTGWAIPSEWIVLNEDGSVTINFEGGFGGNTWDTQANFLKDLVIGQPGEFYRIDFEYTMTAEGGNVQIYDGSTVDSMPLEVGAHKTGSLSYDGGQLTINAYMSFELGAIPADTAFSFTLHSISLSKVNN